MNYVAITPDAISAAEVITHLPRLHDRHVSHLYLRARGLHTDMEELTMIIRSHGIMPLVHRDIYRGSFKTSCGIHTRSEEHFESIRTQPGVLQTASCHSAAAACDLLDNGADYVFISPVYRPFSKPGDRRPLIAPDELRMLARRYGERIVLLGGLTPERINNLQTMLESDFSVAGISMFFNTGTTNEQAPNPNIHQ